MDSGGVDPFITGEDPTPMRHFGLLAPLSIVRAVFTPSGFIGNHRLINNDLFPERASS